MLGQQKQRLLTGGEIADFLSRHPWLALKVAATKTAMSVIGYDYLASPPAWYEIDVNVGLISPSGISVDDEKYGVVVIQPAPNGTIYFNGWTTVRPSVINAPTYQSPNVPEGEECDWLCQADKWRNAILFVAGSFLAIQVIKAVRK
jgi:hypothetical protein